MLRFIDGHLDLAYLAVNGRDLHGTPPSGACITIPTLQRGGVGLVLGTIFTAPGESGPECYPDSHDREAAHAAGLRQLAVYEAMDAAGEIRLVRTAGDLPAETGEAPPAVVILMEGADPIRTPDDVAWWFERGLRAAGLTWANGTRYAGGNASGGGLSAEGAELVRALDAHGVLHDASHLSDLAFDDLLATTDACVVATHSNCRELMGGEDERHLRDDQIRAIADRSGVIGLNLYTRFLAHGRRATIDDCVRHLEHVCAVAGRRDVVALGSDADGGFGAGSLPLELECVDGWARLTDALTARDWTEQEVDGFARENWRRVLEDRLPGDGTN